MWVSRPGGQHAGESDTCSTMTMSSSQVVSQLSAESCTSAVAPETCRTGGFSAKYCLPHASRVCGIYMATRAGDVRPRVLNCPRKRARAPSRNYKQLHGRTLPSVNIMGSRSLDNVGRRRSKASIVVDLVQVRVQEVRSKPLLWRLLRSAPTI